MTSVTRVPLCSAPFCPFPNEPDFHVCWVCLTPLNYQHAHVDPRKMGGSKSRKYDPNNIVGNCESCHRKVTLNEWADRIVDGKYHVWVRESHETVVVREMDWWRNDTLIERRLNDDSQPRQGDHAEEAEPVLPQVPEAGAGGLPAVEVAALGDGAAEGAVSSGPNAGEARNASGHGERVLLNGVPFGLASSSALVPELLELPGEMTREDAVEIAQHIRQSRERSPWLAGDLLNTAEKRWRADPYGESWTDTGDSLVDVLGLKYPSARNYQRVCAAISNTRRRGIPFSHWAIMYALPEEKQEACVAWLLASDPMPSVGKLRKLLGTAREAVKRWRLEELRDAALEAGLGERDGAGVIWLIDPLDSFLDWLAGATEQTFKGAKTRYSVAELRESLAGYQNQALRNRGRQFCEAWLETLG